MKRPAMPVPDWEDLAATLKDASARPFIPYNFLHDLPPESLRRLDNILERHLEIDEHKSAIKSNGHVSGPVLCRYKGCMEVCRSGHHRGQHERHVHGKAKSDV